jgi:hypothetical protein
MRFRFIEDRCAEYPVAIMCSALDVSRADYYARRGRPESRPIVPMASLIRLHGNDQPDIALEIGREMLLPGAQARSLGILFSKADLRFIFFQVFDVVDFSTIIYCIAD